MKKDECVGMMTKENLNSTEALILINYKRTIFDIRKYQIGTLPTNVVKMHAPIYGG